MMLGEVANKHRDLDHMASRSLEMKKDSNSEHFSEKKKK